MADPYLCTERTLVDQPTPMKARYTLPLFALGLAFAAHAQVVPVTLLNANGEEVNGTTLQVQQELNGDLGQILVQALDVQNITGSTRTINVKRYELTVLPGSQNYFCWGVCYDAAGAGERPSWVSQHPVVLNAGETSSNFYGDYKPMGNPGMASFRFVWFDMDSPNDSAWVDVAYTALEAAGISEVAAVRGFTAFPNPSVDGSITFNYDLARTAPDTRLALYNILGERKLVKAIGSAQGTVKLDEGELSSGVWFAVLERNGKPLATRRIAVVR